MHAFTNVISAPLKLLGLVPKMPALPPPAPMVTRDDAAARISADDALAKRRGGAADIVTGAGGAEASLSGGKQVLGQ